MTRTRVVSLGSRLAGDDGVGPAVLAELRRRTGGRDLAMRELASAAQLVDVLLERGPVVLVDAVIGEPAGQIRELAPDELALARARGLHDLGAATAIHLARILAARPLELRIVAITIACPRPGLVGLAPAVAAAVAGAADRVLAACAVTSA